MADKRDQLKVEKRSVLGKKVKKLRREGILPANIYGKEMKSTAVQLPLKEFQQVFKKVHETGLVDLEVNGEKLPVLIHNVQFSPLAHEPVHADFYKVNLREKITASVPLIAIGEPKAVLDKKGFLLTLLSEIEVEALPTDLPEKIEVSVKHLAEVDEQVTIGEVKALPGVTILTDAGQAAFKIGELVTKEAEEQAAAEEAAAAAAAAEAGEVTAEAVEQPAVPTEEKTEEIKEASEQKQEEKSASEEK